MFFFYNKMTNWTDHVIRESRRLGISYGCAMTDQRVKDSYKKLSSPKKVSPKRPKGRPKKALGISYISDVGRTSYQKPFRLKKKKLEKSSNIDEELDRIEQEYAVGGSLMLPVGALPSLPITPPRAKATLSQSVGLRPSRGAHQTDTTKKTFKKILEMSPIKSPDFSRLIASYTKKSPKKSPKSPKSPKKSPVIKRVSFSSSTPETLLGRTEGKKSREEISPRIIRSPTPPRKSRKSIFRNPVIRRKLFVPDERSIGIVGRKTGEKTRRVVGRDSDNFENVDEFPPFAVPCTPGKWRDSTAFSNVALLP